MLFFGNRFKLCEAFGIPVYVDISFAILLLLFVGSGATFTEGMTEALLLALSIVLHEFGHSLTARLFGYRTNDITISLLGGCASLISLPRKAWQEFLTALAGPMVSFALGVCGLVALSMYISIDWLDALLISSCELWQRKVESHWLAFSFWYLMWMNFVLGVFNLLPGFPMDGGRIFRSVLMLFLSRPKATFVAMWVGRVFAILLGLSGLNAIVYGGGWGFIRILIAWMIWKEGYREYQLALMESSWEYEDYRARVSPPPYGGDGDDVDVTRS